MDGLSVLSSFISISIQEKINGNSSRYKVLLRQLGQDVSEGDSVTLARWFQALTYSVSSLSQECHEVVNLVVSVNPSVCYDDYFDFVENLVSAHPYYAVPCVSNLVGMMKSDVENLHDIIAAIVEIVPMSASHLLKNVNKKFPFNKEDKQVQMNYFGNVFKLMGYVPVLRNSLMEIVVTKLLQIDVEIQVEIDELDEEELEKVQEAVLKGGDEVDEGDEDEDEKQIEKRNEIVEKEIDSDSDEEVDDEDDEDEVEEQISDIKASIETLDSLMKLTFENVKEIMEKEEDKEMFLVFMSIFEKTILRTFNSRYVQFIFFYVTSLDSKYHDIFLGMLMSKLFNNRSVILCDPIRISCAGYIGSFIARGLFLSDKLISKCFSMLISWAVQYVDNVQDVNKIEDHSLFYCIVQALLYIFCFRYELLMNETNKELLEKVLFSSLEPLLVCVESVTEEFIDVCSHLNFIFCRHLVEKKERSHLSILDSFFPFDPYKLKESSLFLDPLNIYKEYTSINDEVEQEDNTIYDSPSQESTSSITNHLNSLWQQNITVN